MSHPQYNHRLFKERLLALLAGCLFVLLGLEGALRLLGHQLHQPSTVDSQASPLAGRHDPAGASSGNDPAGASSRNAPARASTGKDPAGASQRVILCIGESTTFDGTSTSYPTLLQDELRRRLPGSSLIVVNDGFPGGDSTTILASLDQHLAYYRPQLVLAMMGINDKGDRIPFTGTQGAAARPTWRVARLSAYLKRTLQNQKAMQTPSDTSQVEDEAADQRLSIPAREQLRQRIEEARRIAALGSPDGFVPAFEQALKLAPDSQLLKIEFAEAYLWNVPPPLGPARRFAPARALLEDVLAHDPHQVRARLDLALGHFTSEQVAEGRHHLHLACLEPWDEVSLESERAFFSLIYWLRKAPEPLVGERLEQLCAAHPQNATYFSHTARYFSDLGDGARSQRYQTHADALCQGLYAPVTATHYQLLRERLARSHTGLLCVQYAGRSVTPLKRLVGSHPGVWFADTENEFAQARKTHAYKDLFFDTCYGDLGHGTALGNHLIAQKVADVILGDHLDDPARIRQAFSSPTADSSP